MGAPKSQNPKAVSIETRAYRYGYSAYVKPSPFCLVRRASCNWQISLSISRFVRVLSSGHRCECSLASFMLSLWQCRCVEGCRAKVCWVQVASETQFQNDDSDVGCACRTKITQSMTWWARSTNPKVRWALWFKERHDHGGVPLGCFDENFKFDQALLDTSLDRGVVGAG